MSVISVLKVVLIIMAERVAVSATVTAGYSVLVSWRLLRRVYSVVLGLCYVLSSVVSVVSVGKVVVMVSVVMSVWWVTVLCLSLMVGMRVVVAIV